MDYIYNMKLFLIGLISLIFFNKVTGQSEGEINENLTANGTMNEEEKVNEENKTNPTMEVLTPLVEDLRLKELESEEISSPNFSSDFACGYSYKLGTWFGVLSHNETDVPLYHLNKTAEKLSSEGFEISDQNVHGDFLYNFTYSNGSDTSSLGYKIHHGIAPIGGKLAPFIRAYYMAQIGEKNDEGITWLCDGVLINRQWILTAAHCFTLPRVEPNVVRLGDYDLTVPPEEGFDIWGKFIEDYTIEDVIPYPEFNVNRRYHDIALLKIPRKIPNFPASINPICLPWDNQTNLNLVESEVVLTGWGATEFGGPKTPVLQEVTLKVFNSSVCNFVYKKFPYFRVKFPSGMSDDNILCAGWEQDGEDACKGDSGGPIVYSERDSFGHEYFILAGIVSGGIGCGRKEYPGIYIPINKPKYLQWIKEIAFKEYN